MNLVAPPIAMPSPALAGPLPQHLEQIADARVYGKKLRRACAVATLSGWSLAAFGGITILTGFFDAPALLLGAGLCLLGWFELRGARDLRRLDPAAPRRLARNQIFLGLLIIAYAGFMMLRSHLDPGPLSSTSSDPQVTQVLGSFDDLARGISIMFYGLIMLVGILAPGLTAFYYASRRKHVEAFSKSAAPWIVELHRKGISV